jgi:hypothetical protein
MVACAEAEPGALYPEEVSACVLAALLQARRGRRVAAPAAAAARTRRGVCMHSTGGRSRPRPAAAGAPPRAGSRYFAASAP